VKKKLVIVVALATVLSTGTVFAGNFGIGVHGGFGIGGIGGGAGLNLGFGDAVFVYVDALGLGSATYISGAVDFVSIFRTEFLDTLSFYIRAGVGAAFWGFDDTFGLAAAARLPIGLSWRPISLLEVFLQVVPQIGVQITPDVDLWTNFFGGNLGLRLWF
jgi:hypothetical protein